MFKLLGNIASVVVKTALTPIAVAIDVVTLPASSMDLRRGPFDKTEALLKSIGKDAKNIVDD